MENNVNFVINNFNLFSNQNLSCIQVDDVAYSNEKWVVKKDPVATYSTDCSTLGIEETVF